MALKIVLTGGGTAGHVMPHLALLREMKKLSWSPIYIGTDAIEKELMTQAGLSFHTISAGKLRRHFSIQNFFDIFKCVWGFVQSLFYLMKIKPDLVFSKGGYVSVPVCAAAWFLRIPITTHESDVTPGLANKIIMKMTKNVFYSFPRSKKHLPASAKFVPLPVRDELFEGSKEKALELCRFDQKDKRPVLLLMGGSQGALRVNQLLLASFDQLQEKFRVIHVTGRGKKTSLESKGSYFQLEYAKEELAHFLALADLIVSRSGANSLFEFRALGKPMLLFPLVLQSRGDQIINAECFEEEGLALVRFEDKLSSRDFVSSCLEAYKLFEKSKSLDLKEAAEVHQNEKRIFLKKLYACRF